MGKKMDALLGRNFKTAKFKTLVNLSISRLAVLKNQRQVRCTHARSDTAELLNLGHQDRALLRVEVVIKEQNMLDVFVMIEGYCHVLIERVALIEKNKECPDELKEAASGLIYAASRSGDLPELQEIRSIFASRFGKDFIAQAVELRNKCAVNPKMIQKLSTRQPSYESRKKMLQEIASENGVTLHLEEEASVTTNAEKEDKTNKLINEVDRVKREEQTSWSPRTRQRYTNVASAAQAAFESAAYAAAAARAAVELSRFESQDDYPNDGSSHNRRRRASDNDGSSKSRLGNHVVDEAFAEIERSTSELEFEKIRPMENSSPESETEGRNRKGDLERSLSASSIDSAGDSQNKQIFDKSDDEYSAAPRSTGYGLGVGGKSSLYTNEFPDTRQHNTITDLEQEIHSKRLNIERRPISVRNRRR